jgi:hypothetical protein
MQSMKLRGSAKDRAAGLTLVNSNGHGGAMAKATTARPVVHAAVQAQNLVKVGK